MACHNCSSFEHFTEECPSKKMMNSCLYTAQGMYLCKNDNNTDLAINVAKNIDMMHSVQDMYNPNYARTLKSVSKPAGTWQEKPYSQ